MCGHGSHLSINKYRRWCKRFTPGFLANRQSEIPWRQGSVLTNP